MTEMDDIHMQRPPSHGNSGDTCGDAGEIKCFSHW